MSGRSPASFFRFNPRQVLAYSWQAQFREESAQLVSRKARSNSKHPEQTVRHMNKGPESKEGQIEKKVLIQAPPEIIYNALTDARDLVRWFCDRASSEPREGGELVAYWKSGKTGIKGRARYVKLEPNTLVELLWVDEGQGSPSDNATHSLSYSIRSRRGTSEVVMTDRDEAPLNEDALESLTTGWNSVLLELKDYCERRARSGKAHPQEKA
jgi:uncharacterized protein YndB with AHSA1/START domain